jgi:hypothetical protein
LKDTNELRRVSRLFSWKKVGLIYKNGGKCKKVWAVFGKSEEM